MEVKINIDSTYLPSEEIVAREVQGEFIIIPITSGIGDLEDEIFTLNETGKTIWGRLDGKKTLKDVASDLSRDFDTPPAEIEEDVKGFVGELLKRKMVVELPR